MSPELRAPPPELRGFFFHPENRVILIEGDYCTFALYMLQKVTYYANNFIGSIVCNSSRNIEYDWFRLMVLDSAAKISCYEISI